MADAIRYPIAERFKAVQGEGTHAGLPMAFVRLVGCSVGQKVCTHCDTDFDRMYEHLGGGLYTVAELVEWARPYHNVCVTGGEPLDRDLRPLVSAVTGAGMILHVETSGTKWRDWLSQKPEDVWLTVSPKPGYREDVLRVADDIKVILGGLGDGPGWPTVDDAVEFNLTYDATVFVQPRNSKLDIDRAALAMAMAVVDRHPELRLSVQLHKFLKCR